MVTSRRAERIRSNRRERLFDGVHLAELAALTHAELPIAERGHHPDAAALDGDEHALRFARDGEHRAEHLHRHAAREHAKHALCVGSDRKASAAGVEPQRDLVRARHDRLEPPVRGARHDLRAVREVEQRLRRLRRPRSHRRLRGKRGLGSPALADEHDDQRHDRR
jgi:hypothetical protein